MQINILLAEDYNIVRDGIKMLLEAESGFKVVGGVENGQDLLALLKTNIQVDLILTDINMPGMDGISLIQEIKKINEQIKVVMLSMHDTEKYVFEAFVQGASGYLLKNVSSEELIFSLKNIQSGGKYLCNELTIKMLENWIHQGQYRHHQGESSFDFSEREIEILHLIAEGLTNSEMSEKLFLSKRTIEGHRQSLLTKTKSKNTATLIRFAILNGIVN